MMKITHQSDIIRRIFLEKQLETLPTDIINIIRDYDPIFRDQFTNKVLKNLTNKVYVFWHKKMLDFTGNLSNIYVDFSVYMERIDYYYEILWSVLIIPPIKYKI
jgi:hypothetical protein